MHRLVALAVLLTAIPVIAARADYPVEGPRGLPCRYLTAAKSTGDEQAGYLLGGPYLASGTLTCTIGSTSVSASGTDVVALRPTPVGVSGYGWNPVVYVCTTFTPPGGPTLYWHETVVSGVGHWSLRNTGDCGRNVSVEQPTYDEAMNEVYSLLVCCFEGWEERLLCEFFFSLSFLPPEVLYVDPEDGDIYIRGDAFLDCPPYGPY